MEQQKRAEIFGAGDEPIRHFLKIPAYTLFARDAEGKLFPVPPGDPRAIGFTPETVIQDLDAAPPSIVHLSINEPG